MLLELTMGREREHTLLKQVAKGALAITPVSAGLIALVTHFSQSQFGENIDMFTRFSEQGIDIYFRDLDRGVDVNISKNSQWNLEDDLMGRAILFRVHNENDRLHVVTIFSSGLFSRYKDEFYDSSTFHEPGIIDADSIIAFLPLATGDKYIEIDVSNGSIRVGQQG